ncbi:MAG: response regulator transcription factor [Bacteroidetes bacterium]|nr:response regulator transcription factor [Bacteroidota bacterium]
MLRTIIIDDEQPNIDLLINLTRKYCPEVEIIATADNVNDGLEIVLKNKPDLLFLDVELHSHSGFEILEAVDTEYLNVVMVTAFEKYAVKAFKHSVKGYLLKPVIITELVSVVQKIQKLVDKQKGTTEVHQAIDTSKILAISSKEQIELLQLEEIVRLEADGSYTQIYCVDGSIHLSSRPLKDYEDKLPSTIFLRVHNSHIVNIKFVQKIMRTRNGNLVMTDNTEIPVSPNRKKDISDRIVV